MCLNFIISISIYLATILILHLILPCLDFLPWEILTIVFIVSLSLSVALHVSHWKCWKFILSSRPKRKTIDFKQMVLFTGWLYVITGSVLTIHCQIFPWSLVTIIPMIIYTCSFFSSSDEPSSDEPSNVNAPSLLESKTTSSSDSTVARSSMSSPSSTTP